MKTQKIFFLVINVLGGAAVVGSYVLGLLAHPGQVESLWGGVPTGIRPFYTANMLLAAAGFLAAFFFLLLGVDAEAARIGKFRFTIINLVYLGILVPSALWMSLTYAVAAQYSLAGWIAVVAVLVLAGLSSIGLLAALLALRPRTPKVAYWLAVVGSAFLVLQTAVLDATVWTLFYLR